jgi:hypothetical protein
VGASTAPTVNASKASYQDCRRDRADHQLLSDQLHRHIADNLTLQPENINVRNSACGTSINVGAVQNALTVNVVPVPPQP